MSLSVKLGDAVQLETFTTRSELSWYICDPLRENRPFAKNFQNALGAPKVKLAKKLIPNLNNFGEEVESPFFSLHYQQS